MTGKKWLLICTFAMVLVIGLGLIIPQDVWNARDAGSTENDAAGLDGNNATAGYDAIPLGPEEELTYFVYNNETLADEPLYRYENGSYDIAYAPALPVTDNTTSNTTLYDSWSNVGFYIVEDEYLEEPLYIVDNDQTNQTNITDATNTVKNYSVIYDNESYEPVDNFTLALLPAHELDDADGAMADEGTAPLGINDASSIGWIFQSAVYIVVCAIIFALMFARLSNEDIMAGIRKHIYNFISENPGEHLASITKEFNMSSSSARHHLYVLETSDKIVSHKPGKYKHYYVNQNGYSRFTNGSEYKAVISALRNDTSRGIVKVLDQGNDMNQLMLSQALGIHPSTVNWHAKRLMAADIIRKDRRGKDMIYSLNDEIDIHRMISIIEGTSS